tara:strand:- start:10 stop:360 length:351 start_codon:yes stop_codon:yes gene_type:complete
MPTTNEVQGHDKLILQSLHRLHRIVEEYYPSQKVEIITEKRRKLIAVRQTQEPSEPILQRDIFVYLVNEKGRVVLHGREDKDEAGTLATHLSGLADKPDGFYPVGYDRPINEQLKQ